MPKYRIYDEDGIFRGGLFDTDVHHRHNSRVWTGTPRPHYAEHLFDLSEGEWILLRLSHEPRVTGSREYDNEFDEASHATRLCDETAHRWFIRNELSQPADLLARLASTSDASVGLGGRGEGAGSLAEIADAGVRDGTNSAAHGEIAARAESRPVLRADQLSAPERAVLIALEMALRQSPPRALDGGELRKACMSLPTGQRHEFRDDDHVRRTVYALRKRGLEIPNVRNGTGYVLKRPLQETVPDLANAIS